MQTALQTDFFLTDDPHRAQQAPGKSRPTSFSAQSDISQQSFYSSYTHLSVDFSIPSVDSLLLEGNYNAVAAALASQSSIPSSSSTGGSTTDYGSIFVSRLSTEDQYGPRRVVEMAFAAITLASIVKEMDEVAEKIHASFEKVSGNLRNAQILASEIKQTVNELRRFCEQRQATLENNKMLRIALLELTAKLKTFYSNIVPLIPSPSTSPRILSRVTGGFKTRKNDEHGIESSLRELKEEVKKRQTNVMMMTVAQIQVKLSEIQRSTVLRAILVKSRPVGHLEVIKKM